jgi:hypothetical protein
MNSHLLEVALAHAASFGLLRELRLLAEHLPQMLHSGLQDHCLAAPLALNAGYDVRQLLEAGADRLTALLLGFDVVFLLLLGRQARLVGVAVEIHLCVFELVTVCRTCM